MLLLSLLLLYISLHEEVIRPYPDLLPDVVGRNR